MSPHETLYNSCIATEAPCGDAGAPGADPSRVWLPEVVACIASYLPPSEVACALRLVSSETARQFDSWHVVKLSQPSPRWAFAEHWSAPGACRCLSLSQRRQLIVLTAAAGDVANLEVAVTAAGCEPPAEALEAAAASGRLQACQWLSEPCRLPASVDWQEVLCAAAKGGQRAACHWALNDGRAAWSAEAVLVAARRGHMALAEWLMSLRPAGIAEQVPWMDMLRAAAEGCDAPTLRRLCEQRGGLGGTDWKRTCVQHAAIASRTEDWQDKAELLESTYGCLLDPVRQAYEWCAALPGQTAVERFAWLRSRGRSPLGTGVMDWAVQAGNPAALRYLAAQGFKAADLYLVWQAARRGQLPVLQALAEAGVLAPTRRTALEAAGGGSLPVLEWLVEAYGWEQLGGPTPELLTAAAGSGSSELLAWLLARAWARQPQPQREPEPEAQLGEALPSPTRRSGSGEGLGGGGCGATEAAWASAAAAGCEAALELLEQAGCPKPADGAPHLAAACNGDLPTLRVLSRLGMPYGPADGELFARAVCDPDQGAEAPLPALRLLAESGCPVDWGKAAAAAVQRRSGAEEEVRAWVGEQATAMDRTGGGKEGPRE